MRRIGSSALSISEDPAGRAPGAGGVNSELVAWLSGRSHHNWCTVKETSLSRLTGWSFAEDTGNLVHDSGGFFSIEGLRVRASTGPVREWTQPIINQPEIGILGILLKRIDGIPHCLMQAKAEPGNPHGIQISPTVQATRSNYMRVHAGSGTRYLEHFLSPRRGRVLVDVLQSEQGSWFFGKRNRNMVVETQEEIAAGDDFRWIPLADLRGLFRIDNLVNMDTRTVLACLPPQFAGTPNGVGGGDGFSTALARSSRTTCLLPGSAPSLLSWLVDAKTRHRLDVDRIPLADISGWRLSDGVLDRSDGRYFRVLGAEVTAASREVARWTQPMLAPCGRGIVALFTKVIDGVAHFLVQARVLHGYRDTAEIGPTIHCIPDNYRGYAADDRPEYLDYLLNEVPRDWIRYDRIQSEEGGRFYRAENRYVIVEVDDGLRLRDPERFRWATLGELVELLRHSYYLNVEVRSLLACLHSLW